MREILFRGKSLKTRKWIQGYLFRCWGHAYIAWGMINDNADMVEVDPETVCQYTGLTDKNGRKIFECDIVKHDISDTIGTAKWYCEDYAGWCVDDVQIGEQQFTYEMWGECEIIGNIFDNVDLLKE